MALYPNALDALVSSVNALNNVQLSPDNYTLSTPEVIANTTGKANTRIVLSAKDINSPFEGAIALTYTRLDLADLQRLFTPTIGVFQPARTQDVVEALNYRYGLNLAEDDILDEPLTLTDNEGPVTLKANPASVGWIGEVTIEVVKGNYPIGQYLTNTRLPSLSYPALATNKPYAGLYSYWRDFSPARDTLQGVTTGTTSLEAVREALEAVTGDAWVTTGSSRYSLAGARVTFHGDTADNETLNAAYARGVIVTLSDQCLGLAGELILNYNDNVA